MDTLPESLQAAIAPAYELERELAGGGMSRVFLANDRKLERKVVVKVLPPDLAAGVNRDRFRREIQFAAQLLHPHIVQVISAGETDELLYYTMPYIEGESLRTVLERGELSSKRVVKILHDVVDALAYAHERGVIHRDIKPGNILTLGSHALVTDFGVAKAITAAMPGSGVTSAGMAIGTPAYMAPEQLAADPAADHRVDIYAVGLLAYELLTGSSPFRQESPQATMAAQLTRVPTPLDVCCPGVSPELSRIVMRCLEKAPADRPSSAKALLAELDNLGMTSAAGVPAGFSKSPQRNRTRILATAAGGLALIAVAAAGYAAFLAKARVAAAVPPVVDTMSPPSVQPKVTPAAPVTPRARVLSHADSLAIARAMRSEMPVPVVTAPPLVVASSLAGAAPATKPTLLIMFPRATPMRQDLTEAARSFAEDLRKAAGASGNYSLVPIDEIRRMRPPQRDARNAPAPIRADVVVTMAFVGNEPQSLVVQLRHVPSGRTSSVVVLTSPSGSTTPLLKDRDAALGEALARLQDFTRK